MNREEARKICLEEVNKHKCLLLNLPTGYGKSKLAIDSTNKICENIFKLYRDNTKVLLVVAKSIHKKNWKAEIDKWGGLKTKHLTVECYNSLHKYRNKNFDVVILDECHHLSELKRDILESITINEVLIGLSATIPLQLKEWFTNRYDTFIVSNSLQKAIDDGVLPEPKIYLIPLEFDNNVTEVIYKNIKKGKKVFESCWAERWKYIKAKVPVRIYCTKAQYYEDLNSQINYFKRRALYSQSCKNRWLRLCNDRLKWLSEKKEDYVKALLDKFKEERTLTFCSSIEQTKRLGKNCIHSKNKKNQKVYDNFNNYKIDHITSCQMLNEGMNLTNCRIGIYANINASDTINKQKFGRLLRHENPIIIIPYYKRTREEEVLGKILIEYNPKLVTTITDLNQLKL